MNYREIATMRKSALNIERVQCMSSLGNVRDEWNALLQQSETKTVELTYEWQTLYWKYFNDNSELFVLLVKEAGAIVAIAPLKITRLKSLGMDVRRLELIAAVESNYQDIVIGKNSEDILVCILDYLFENSSSWDVLYLRNIPEMSTTTEFLRYQLAGYPSRKVINIEKCMYLEINRASGTPLESFRKKSKNLAYQIRRLERELGGVSLQLASTAEQFRTDMLVFYDLHRGRWNPTETPSMFNDEMYCKFYLDATLQLNSKNGCELWTLVAGDAQLAQLLGFTFGKYVVVQLLAYNINYRKYSPELVLMELYVNHLLSIDTEIMDFGSYNPYKEQWTNRLKNRVSFQIYPKRFWPSCLYALTITRDTFLYSLRKSGFLLNVAKYIRRKVRLLSRNHP